MLRRRAASLVLVIALAGCAQRQPVPSPVLLPELGVGPTVEPAPEVGQDEGVSEASPSEPPSDHASSPEATGAPSSGGASPADATPSDADAATPRPTEAPSLAAVRRTLLTAADATGDHGVEGPAHADLAALVLVDLGDRLSVEVRFAGPVPRAPADGEVILVGVDLLEQADGESAYQLFVDGGAGEWGAYLQTPDGFVPYPGTFTISGSSILLTVPWNALGSPTRGPVRAFVEWSQQRLLLNAAATDRLDGQPHTFDRNP